MKRKVWMAGLTVVASGLLVLTEAGTAETQTAYAPEREPTPGSRWYANAHVVAFDVQARTVTLRGGGLGEEETFTVESPAMQQVGVLTAGQEVLVAFRAGGPGADVVTGIEKAAGGADGPQRAASGRAPGAGGVAGKASTKTESAPSTAPPPAPSPTPSPEPTRLPTDIVGPLHDPRRDPDFDPRQNPLRDPRVVPGLSEPAPTPTPTPEAEPSL
jgi:hypothetical protein